MPWANAAKKAAYEKDYQKTPQRRAYHRAWQRAHPRDQREYLREYAKRPELLERRRAAARAYYERHKQQSLNRTRLYEFRMRGATGMHTADEWVALVEEYGHRCIYCGRLAKELCRDHVVAISQGGTNDIENIVPACRSCNASKGARPLLVFLLKRAA